MIRIFRYLKPKEWGMAFAALCFIVTQVYFDLRLPDYMSEVTRLTQTQGSSIAEIWRNGGFMMLCAFGSLLSAVGVGYLAARTSASFTQRLRSLLFSKVVSLTMEDINRFSTASLITRSSNDITQIQMLIAMGMQTIVKAPITAGWAVTKIAGKGLEWSMVTGMAVLILLTMFSFLLVFVVPKFNMMQLLTDSITRVARENLTGLQVVRAYNAQAYQEEKFEEANNELTKVQMFTTRAMSIHMPVMTLLNGGLSLAIYWIGAYLINAAGALERLPIFSNMVVFSSYSMQIIMSFMMMFMIFVMLPRASVSAKRINEVLDTATSIEDGSTVMGEGGMAGEIEFRSVSFAYPDAADAALKDVSFRVSRGQTLAIIGSTGSGKTTLVNLILRFYDVTEGEVLVNGVNVKEYTQHALLNKIGYASQQAVLFKGTVTDNVAFGENGSNKAYSQNDVVSAVAIAQGKDFVEGMEGKYSAAISQGGANLSGGQKQRLAIARAVCRKPEIYVFDDTFSALDYKTDRLLRGALRREVAGITSIIVAQRIGTVMDADQIIVLDEGRIVGNGTHKELLGSCAVYREIAASQLSEEELAS